jgi:hypothetical protein
MGRKRRCRAELGTGRLDLQNRQVVAAPRLDGSTPSPLRRGVWGLLLVLRSRVAGSVGPLDHQDPSRPPDEAYGEPIISGSRVGVHLLADRIAQGESDHVFDGGLSSGALAFSPPL